MKAASAKITPEKLGTGITGVVVAAAVPAALVSVVRLVVVGLVVVMTTMFLALLTGVPGALLGLVVLPLLSPLTTVTPWLEVATTAVMLTVVVATVVVGLVLLTDLWDGVSAFCRPDGRALVSLRTLGGSRSCGCDVISAFLQCFR